MSKYCLKVWDSEFEGPRVYKDGAPFVGTFPQVYTYKADMEMLNPNATYKIFHWNEVSGAGEELLDSEPQEHIVKRKGNKVVVKAGEGYCEHVDKLCTVKDTMNGYHICFNSSSSAQQDVHMSLDYAQAEYLWLALSEFAKDWKQN